jgi:hypothetical protein
VQKNNSTNHQRKTPGRKAKFFATTLALAALPTFISARNPGANISH